MQTVLIISSLVAASRVGASASAFCLNQLGHESIILPTTLMGRHPGWGDPGGGAVEAARLLDMWSAIKQQDIRIDAVLTGYMGQESHIDIAAQIIKDVKASNPQAYILVDPVMGDFVQDKQAEVHAEQNKGRLYIPEARARAICAALLPLADIITPNLWELGYIAGGTLGAGLGGAREALAVLKDRRQAAIVTSVPHQDEIGALIYNGTNMAAQSHHEKFARVPHGGGDSLAGLYLGHYLNSDTPRLAMRKSVSALFEIMRAAQAGAHAELPLITNRAAIHNSPPLDFINLDI